MPLSDHERRLLEEMEQALSAEDPKLVSTFQESPAGKGAVLGIALILLGLAGLFAGLFTQLPIVGVFGFIVALAGTVTVIPKVAAPKVRRPKRSVSSKMEDRWNRRSYE